MHMSCTVYRSTYIIILAELCHKSAICKMITCFFYGRFWPEPPSACPSDAILIHRQTPTTLRSFYDATLNGCLCCVVPSSILEYQQLHSASIATMRNGSDRTFRLLVFDTYLTAGLGNRLIGLLSALLLAWCTNRTLLVCWPDVGSTQAHPSGEKFAMPKLSTLLQPHPLLVDCDMPPFASIRSRSETAFVTDYSSYFLTAVRYFDINEVYPQTVIHLTVIADLTSLLVENEHYGPMIRNFFGERPLSLLARHVIRPSAEVSVKSSELLAKIRKDSVPSIGVHIRLPPLPNSVDREKWSSVRETAHAWTCVEAISRYGPPFVDPNFRAETNGMLQEHLTVFLATDSEDLRIRSQSSSFSVVTSDGCRDTTDGIIATFAELVVLSRVDKFVAFGRSTFSHLIAALRLDNVFSVDGYSCVKVSCTDLPSEPRSGVTVFRGVSLRHHHERCMSDVALPGKRVALLIYATGSSVCQVENVVSTGEKYFLPRHSVHYFIFACCSGNKLANMLKVPTSHFTVISTTAPSYRDAFLEGWKQILRFDFVYMLDPSYLFSGPIAENILVDSVSSHHAFDRDLRKSDTFFGGKPSLFRKILFSLDHSRLVQEPVSFQVSDTCTDNIDNLDYFGISRSNLNSTCLPLQENIDFDCVRACECSAFPDKQKVGILVMATGKYASKVANLISSMAPNFVVEHERTFFIFSDSPTDFFENELARRQVKVSLKVVYTPHASWPFGTLKRFHTYLQHWKLLRQMDFLFAVDADMLFVGTVGDEVLSSLVGTLHPGYYKKPPTELPHESSPNSSAFVPVEQRKSYFAGGVYGGSIHEMKTLLEHLAANINSDYNAGGYVAVWHDESHLNRYFCSHPPTSILTPNYVYPEPPSDKDYHHLKDARGEPLWDIKIVALNKKHDEMRS